VVAAQTKQSFAPYITKNEREIELVEAGSVSAPQMFAHAQAANRTLTWILRAVGFAAMFFAGMLVLGPISAFARILPFLGSLVEIGFAIVAFLLSAIVSLLVIATAWMFYRPLWAAALILVAIACIVMLKRLHAKRTVTPTPPPLPA
jgi:hypothetical protein